MKRLRRYLWIGIVLIIGLLAWIGPAQAATLFFDDFTGPGSGWSWTVGNGATNAVDPSTGGAMTASAACCSPEFPLVGRNDAFTGINAYWRIALRFRYTEVTAYGSSIAVGSGTFDAASRQPHTAPVRSDWSDILGITQVQGGAADNYFRIQAFGNVHYDYNTDPAPDLAWHVVELTVNGAAYTLRLDGTPIGTGTATATPHAIWLGNYYTQPWWGNWSDMALDWVRVESDREAPATTATLSGTAGNGGWYRSPVIVTLTATDAWAGVAGTQYQGDGGAWQPYSGPFTVAGEGSHTLSYRSNDRAGNSESPGTLTVQIDSVPPGSALAGLTADQWVSGTVTLSGTAGDATSGVATVACTTDGGATWAAVSGTTAWSTFWETQAGPDGTYQVGSRAADLAGNLQTPALLSVRVDNTPPATAAALSGTAGGSGWYRSAVSVTLTATDAGSGVAETDYRVAGGAWQPYSAAFTIAGDGIHPVEYRSRDRLGNQERAQQLTVAIDTCPPDTTATPGCARPGRVGWCRSDVQLDLTASDAASGVAGVEYQTPAGPWTPYAGALLLAGDGTHAVAYRATDLAGNVAPPGNVSVMIDANPPVLTATVAGTAGYGAWYRSGVTVTLAAADATSGLESHEYRVDEGAWTVYTAPVAIAGDGLHTLEQRATDVAGNSTPPERLPLWLDTTPPATLALPEGTLGRAGWWRSAVVVTLVAEDVTAGVDAIAYRIDAGAWQDYTIPFAVRDAGAHTVAYRATDRAGNVAASHQLDLRLDLAPPLTTIAATGAAGDAGWYRGPVAVTLDATDGHSGVDTTVYRIAAGAWLTYTSPLRLTRDGIYPLEIATTDVAGNDEPPQTHRFSIDGQPPAVTATLAGPRAPSGWYTGATVLTLAAADATSGVSHTLLAGQPYSAPVRYTVDGVYGLPYSAGDVAGNRAPVQTVTLPLDSRPPTAAIVGGMFCPECGEVLWVQASASDATSGLRAWRVEIVQAGAPLRRWSGTTDAPGALLWDGRADAGQILPPGTYPLRLWVQDRAGWEQVAGATVALMAAPPPVATEPPATATPLPVPTAAPTPRPTPTRVPIAPTPTPRRDLPRPGPTATPAPTPEPPEPIGEPARSLAVPLLVFQDTNADARRETAEPGLPARRVRLTGPAGTRLAATDERGVVTLTLTAPGLYTVTLVEPPGAGWRATTRTTVALRYGSDGGLVLLPAPLPVGQAEGLFAAIGLCPVAAPAGGWLLPLGSGGFLLAIGFSAVLDRRAPALRVLSEALGEP